jgi:Skp family chaperone for outer membrane proteins
MTPKPSASASASSSISRAARALAAAALLAAGADAAAAGKVGVVDPAAVRRKLVSWQAVQARLRAREAEADGRLERQRAEVERLRKELDYFKPGSDDHAQRTAKLAAARAELAALTARLRSELARDERRAREAADKAVREAVRRYALAHGFDVVVDARAALYVGAAADLSSEVARAMNKRYKQTQERAVEGPEKER